MPACYPRGTLNIVCLAMNTICALPSTDNQPLSCEETSKIGCHSKCDLSLSWYEMSLTSDSPTPRGFRASATMHLIRDLPYISLGPQTNRFQSSFDPSYDCLHLPTQHLLQCLPLSKKSLLATSSPSRMVRMAAERASSSARISTTPAARSLKCSWTRVRCITRGTLPSRACGALYRTHGPPWAGNAPSSAASIGDQTHRVGNDEV